MLNPNLRLITEVTVVITTEKAFCALFFRSFRRKSDLSFYIINRLWCTVVPLTYWAMAQNKYNNKTIGNKYILEDDEPSHVSDIIRKLFGCFHILYTEWWKQSNWIGLGNKVPTFDYKKWIGTFAGLILKNICLLL